MLLTHAQALAQLELLLMAIAQEPPRSLLLSHIESCARDVAEVGFATISLCDSPSTELDLRDMALPAMHAEATGHHTVRPCLSVPILWRDQRIGCIELGRPLRGEVDAERLNLIALIALQSAYALRQANRDDAERRRAQRFQLIARIAREIQQELDIDTLLQRAADAIHEVLQFPNVDIPLVDPAAPDVLVVRIRGGSYKRAIRRVDRLPFSRGIMGAAARERRTQMVNDVQSDPRYVCPPEVAPALAELAIPICSGHEVLGVLNIEGNNAFDDLDRGSLEVVADYLAVAINNARLFQQARETAVIAERQRLARDLHDNVTQVLSSMSLLSQTLAEAWRRDPSEGERRAARLHQLAQTAFAEMRMLLRELVPSNDSATQMVSKRSRSLLGIEQLKRHALPGALTRLLAAMVPEALELKLDFAGYQAQCIEHEETFFRVCQEAVSNAIRHAAARRLTVSAMIQTGQAVLRVSDNGRGIDGEFRPGLGLSNMRARLEKAGGLLRIAANSPHGMLIEARLPRVDRLASTEAS